MSISLDEFLDQTLQEDLKGFADTHRLLQAAASRLKRATAEGHLENLQQALERYAELLERQKSWLHSLQEKVPSFDTGGYLQESFHERFMAALAEENLPVEANYPVYEVHPFKVRVIPERGVITINEKTVRTLRPQVIAQTLKKEIKRLNSLPFNAPRFLQTLALVYDRLMCKIMVDKKIEISEQEVQLKEIYNLLAPLPHQKKDYPEQLFAFDLHRLLRENCTVTSDGRKMRLGNVRDRQRAMIVLDAWGQPQRYGTIKFYREEG